MPQKGEYCVFIDFYYQTHTGFHKSRLVVLDVIANMKTHAVVESVLL